MGLISILCPFKLWNRWYPFHIFVLNTIRNILHLKKLVISFWEADRISFCLFVKYLFYFYASHIWCQAINTCSNKHSHFKGRYYDIYQHVSWVAKLHHCQTEIWNFILFYYIQYSVPWILLTAVVASGSKLF